MMEEIEEKDDVVMLYEFNYFINNKIFVYIEYIIKFKDKNAVMIIRNTLKIKI